MAYELIALRLISFHSFVTARFDFSSGLQECPLRQGEEEEEDSGRHEQRT